jgi:septum formation protein
MLAAAGFEFDVMSAEVDETPDIEETPDGYARRLAMEKALALLPRAEGRAVLGAETIVLLDGQMLRKPADDEDATRMLRLLSGREHDVITAVCVARGSRSQTRVDRTRVQFAPLTDEEVHWYISSGEAMDKPGAYGIQGRALRFITRIDGSYSNVMGLPISLVYAMLRES